MRRVLSVAIVYHLFCVLLAPNTENDAGMTLGKYMEPYLFTFEMTNAWNFFSPNPSPPIYIEYELVDPRDQTISRGTWPEKKDPFFLRERQNRRITSTDFMIAYEARTEKMMVPFLCHREPRPNSVRLWRVMYTTPSPSDVASGKRTLGDDVGVDRRFVSHSFCEGAAG